MARRVDDAILAFAPTVPPLLDRDVMMRAVGHDKKFAEGRRVMILPRGIGRCEIVEDIEAAEIEFGIDAITAR
jgi:3-dehydroquinate synthetase